MRLPTTRQPTTTTTWSRSSTPGLDPVVGARHPLSSARSRLVFLGLHGPDGGDSARERSRGFYDNLTSAAFMRDSAGKMDSLHASIKEAHCGDPTTLKGHHRDNLVALAAAIAVHLPSVTIPGLSGGELAPKWHLCIDPGPVGRLVLMLYPSV